MLHKMTLRDKPFQQIKSGKKDIEMRLYDEKRSKIKARDQIEFTNTETNEKLLVNVVAIHIFNNFTELYKSFSKTRLGYGLKEKANPSDMLEYYNQGLQDIYRVVGIEIKLAK